MPYRKIKVKGDTGDILHLPGEQRIITHSWYGSFRIWDLETGMQIEEWEDKEFGSSSIALSPDGKTLVVGSWNGTVKLWSIDTGKVIKTLTGRTSVLLVCWSPDGGRVVCRSLDGTFRVWDVKSGEIILGPIKAGGFVCAVCYSPDGKMIATAVDGRLKIWDGNTGGLLKTFEIYFPFLAWTSNGKTIITWGLGGFQITKFDTATLTVSDKNLVRVDSFVDFILLSPDGHFFAITSFLSRTAQLWNIKTNQSIGTPLHHEDGLTNVTFSPDGKFLFTRCQNGHIYTWDVSAIVREAGLADIVDTTLRPAPKMKGAPRIPPRFFDEANSCIHPSQAYGPYDHPTLVPRQHTLSHVSSFWRRSKSHWETEHHTRLLPHSLNWTRNLISGVLRGRDGSDIELREIEVPCTAGKPRNYHARKKLTASSSQPPKIHTTQKPNASSSQLPPTTTTSTLSAVTGTAGASEIPSCPHITGAGWRARFVGWICCMPVQNADGHH